MTTRDQEKVGEAVMGIGCLLAILAALAAAGGVIFILYAIGYRILAG